MWWSPEGAQNQQETSNIGTKQGTGNRVLGSSSWLCNMLLTNNGAFVIGVLGQRPDFGGLNKLGPVTYPRHQTEKIMVKCRKRTLLNMATYWEGKDRI